MKFAIAFVTGCLVTAALAFGFYRVRMSAYEDALKSLSTQHQTATDTAKITQPEIVAPTQPTPVKPPARPKIEKISQQSEPAEEAQNSPASDAAVVPPAVEAPPVRYATLRPEKDRYVRKAIFMTLAGQELSISNTVFDSVEIDSDLPIAVKIGDCQDTDTTKLYCPRINHDDPILIQDARIGFPPDSSQRNTVTLIATRSALP